MAGPVGIDNIERAVAKRVRAEISARHSNERMVNYMPSPLSADDLHALRRFDTPTICNAIELFGVRPPASGYMDRRIRACLPELPPMVGYASTATFRSAAPGLPAPGGYSLGARQLQAFAELPGPPVVVFQDLDDPPAGATFGDGMCLTYKTFGAVGLITSGAARDLDNVRKLGFPCFADGVICGHGNCHFEAIHVPVRVGGLTIYPGDLLHGDCNGVTTIPHEIAAAAPAVCAEFLRHEEGVLGNLRSGNATLENHRAAIVEFTRCLDEMRRRLRGAQSMESSR